MRKWLADILEVIGSFWSVTSLLLPHLLRLLSELAGRRSQSHCEMILLTKQAEGISSTRELPSLLCALAAQTWAVMRSRLLTVGWVCSGSPR